MTIPLWTNQYFWWNLKLGPRLGSCWGCILLTPFTFCMEGAHIAAQRQQSLSRSLLPSMDVVCFLLVVFFFVGIMLDDFFGCRMPKKRCILDMIPLDCFCFGIMLVGLDVWCPKEETPRLKDVPLQGNDMTYPTKRIIQKINENHQCRAGKRICDSSQEGISAKACKHLHMNLSNQKPSHGLGYFQGDPAPQIGEPTGKFPPLFCLEQIHSVFGVCTKGGFAAFFRDN